MKSVAHAKHTTTSPRATVKPAEGAAARAAGPSPRPRVVAAIPCFNTGPFIADVVSRARRYVDEVIVIDDGSSDGTAEKARAAGAVVVRHKANRGYGEATKSCFEEAKANGADVLVALDGDGQHDPDDIPALLKPILAGEADLVIGSRFLPDSRLRTGDSRPGVIPRYRRVGIDVITLLYNLGSRTKVSDAQSGFRAYSKKLIHAFSLSEKGMAISVQTLVQARAGGFVVKEAPITCSYHSNGSTLNPVRHGRGVAIAVLRIRLWSSLRRLPA